MNGQAFGRGIGVILGMVYCLVVSGLVLYNIQDNPLVIGPPCPGDSV